MKLTLDGKEKRYLARAILDDLAYCHETLRGNKHAMELFDSLPSVTILKRLAPKHLASIRKYVKEDMEGY